MAAIHPRGGWRWVWGEWGLWPGVWEERVPASSPGSVGVAGAEVQARRVRAGHGRTRSGKGAARTELRGGGGTAGCACGGVGTPTKPGPRAALACATDGSGCPAFSPSRANATGVWVSEGCSGVLRVHGVMI